MSDTRDTAELDDCTQPSIFTHVADAVVRMRQFLMPGKGMDKMAMSRVVEPEELALAIKDASYLLDIVPQSTEEDDGMDMLVRSSTNEEIDLKLIPQELHLNFIHSWLYEMATITLFDLYRTFLRCKPVVYIEGGRRKCRWPCRLTVKRMAIAQFFEVSAFTDAKAILAMSIRRFGLDNVIQLTPLPYMNWLVSLLLAPGAGGYAVLNFGGLSLDNCLRLTSRDADMPASRDVQAHDLLVRHALWISRFVAGRDDARRETLTRQFFTLLASVRDMKILTMVDVNLSGACRYLWAWPRVGPRIDSEEVATSTRDSVCPRVPDTAFLGLEKLTIRFTTWALNRGFENYHSFLTWMLPLPALDTLELPEHGNLHGSHIVLFGRFLQQVTHITKLRFHLGMRRQWHKPSEDDIQARQTWATQKKMKRYQRKRMEKRQRKKASTALEGPSTPHVPYTTVCNRSQAEEWGVQARCLISLRALTVWGSTALCWLQWPWRSNLTALELSVVGLDWEIAMHCQLIGEMTQLRQLSWYVGEHEDAPAAPILNNGNGDDSDSVIIKFCTTHRSVNFSSDHAVCDFNNYAVADATDEEETDDEPSPPPVVPMQNKNRCGWCNHGEVVQEAVSRLTALTSLKLWFRGPSAAQCGCCSMFDLTALSTLQGLQELMLTHFVDTVLHAGERDDCELQYCNTILPVWPQLTTLSLDIPVVTLAVGPMDLWVGILTNMTKLREVSLRMVWSPHAAREVVQALATNWSGIQALAISDRRWDIYGYTDLPSEQVVSLQAIFEEMWIDLKKFWNLRSCQVPGGTVFHMSVCFGRPVPKPELPNPYNYFCKLECLEEYNIPSNSAEDYDYIQDFKARHADEQGCRVFKLLHPNWLEYPLLPPNLTRLSMSLGDRALPELGVALGNLTKLRSLVLAYRPGTYQTTDNFLPFVQALGSLTQLTQLCYMGTAVADPSRDRYRPSQARLLQSVVLEGLAASFHKLAAVGNLLQLYLWGVHFIDYEDSALPVSLANFTSLKVLSLFGCEMEAPMMKRFSRVFGCGIPSSVRKLHLFHISGDLYHELGMDLGEFLRGFPNLTSATFGVKEVTGTPSWAPLLLQGHRLHLRPAARHCRLTEKLIARIKSDFERAGVHGALVGCGMLREGYTIRPTWPTWHPDGEESMLDEIRRGVEGIIRAVCPANRWGNMDWVRERSENCVRWGDYN